MTVKIDEYKFDYRWIETRDRTRHFSVKMTPKEFEQKEDRYGSIHPFHMNLCIGEAMICTLRIVQEIILSKSLYKDQVTDKMLIDLFYYSVLLYRKENTYNSRKHFYGHKQGQAFLSTHITNELERNDNLLTRFLDLNDFKVSGSYDPVDGKKYQRNIYIRNGNTEFVNRIEEDLEELWEIES